MTPAMKLTLFACGTFFWTALASGVWKWRAMVSSPEHRAPFYVDTAHRAALLYSFACLVLARFVELSPFSETVNLAAVAAPIAFFAIAIATYLKLGWSDHTDNQFAHERPGQRVGMWLLIAAEIGGFSVLFAGFLIAL